jgi:hypothetical protein
MQTNVATGSMLADVIDEILIDVQSIKLIVSKPLSVLPTTQILSKSGGANS